MSIRTENLKKKRLPCLRCGQLVWTDRCHRLCKKCSANTSDVFVKPILSVEGITLLSDYPLVEELGIVDGDGLGDDAVPALEKQLVPGTDA